MSGATTQAQSATDPIYLTPGQAWTYVPHAVVPAWVRDTTAERLAYISRTVIERQVRRIFYVRHHPELLDTAAERLRVQLPREPGQVDTVTSRNFSMLVLSDSVSTEIAYGAGGSDDAPELRFLDVLAGCSYGLSSPDSLCSGTVNFAPAYYSLAPMRSSDTTFIHAQWGFFVQYVDSLWHPPLDSGGVATQEVFGNGASAARLRCWPSPASPGSEVRFRVPPAWRSDAPVHVRVHEGGTGAVVAFTRVVPATATLEACIELPSGLAPGPYAVVAYAPGGRRAAGWVVVE